MGAIRYHQIFIFGAISMILVSAAGAQKTAQRWSPNGGNRPQSVYGGYKISADDSSAFQQEDVPVSPAQHQRRTQSFKSNSASSQINRPLRLPVSQQQESSYEESASVDVAAETNSLDSVGGQNTPIPQTSFTCSGQPYQYGMYADTETGCRVYHLCYNGRRDSFFCGPGTVFNQRILHCDYPNLVDCASSSLYYSSSNAYMGSSQPEPGPAQANVPVRVSNQQSSSSYSRTINRSLPASSSSINREFQLQQRY